MNGASPPIGVLGAGAWGTALAQLIAGGGRDVLLWAREPEVVAGINADHANAAFLPGIMLDPLIRATGALGDLAPCAVLVAVTPAQHLATVLEGLNHAPADIVLCSKGIVAEGAQLLNAVARAAAPGADVAVLSGPTFAHEVAGGLPTAVTLACANAAQWDRLHPIFAQAQFRPYYSDDVTGAEVGGAVKNVLAIACGVVEGLGLGQNARAALIARGYAEMLRLGAALGARAETLAGLCGLGDLVLTCSSTASRNFSLGKAIGEGADPKALMADRRTVAEGAFTAPVLMRLAQGCGVEMPIAAAVAALLDGAPARMVAADLLARPLRAEQTDAGGGAAG